METSVLRVGLFGATGYAGREAERLLGLHPRLTPAFATGGERLSHADGLERPADAYLLALPHGVSAGFAARLRREHPEAVVIDLSGDLRLPSAEAYAAWYGHPHGAPELLGQAPYGLSEVNRPRIAGARLVANPGCYATSVLLPLLPLVAEGLVDEQDLVVDAKSGATGAGRTPKAELLFTEVAEDVTAYSPGREHRHVGEIEAVLEQVTGRRSAVTFCPHLLPVRRGILSSIHVRTEAAPEQLRLALTRFYAGSAFVRVVDAPPRLADVVGTNDCRISVHAGAKGRAVLFSAIDNLLKGAAGQAVQNLNLALGWPETTGLPVAAA